MDNNIGISYHISWLYGPPYAADKPAFWDKWVANCRGRNEKWLIMGDLNKILCLSKRECGCLLKNNRHNFLRDFMDAAGNLLDVGFKGQAFTWARKENGVIFLQERLDMGLASEEWLLRWPDSSITHLARIGSDHNPLLFNSTNTTPKGRPYFKFESSWADDADATHSVEECWTNNLVLSNLSNWTSNLKNCRSRFLSWSKKKYPMQNREVIRDCLAELDDLQSHQPLSSTDRQQALEETISVMWIREKKYWQRRSRVN